MVIDSSGHHIVYGVLRDYLTDLELRDTDDERLRQRLARLMVEEKGYAKDELQPRLFIETSFNGVYARSTVELTFLVRGRRFMILRYAPGSLVTRERAALAAARLLDSEYRIPLAVVTNARDAELLDTLSGKVLATGLAEAIPNRRAADLLIEQCVFEPFSDPGRREMEERILNAYDVEVCCRGIPCR